MLRLSYRGTFAYVVNPKIEVERNMILTYYPITAKCLEGLKQFLGQLFIINLCFRINKKYLIFHISVLNSPSQSLFDLREYLHFLDHFWTIKSRCIGKSCIFISKILIEYCSIIYRLHFILKKVFLQVRQISILSTPILSIPIFQNFSILSTK